MSPGACRPRTSTPSSRCSARCCCPRRRSPRPPRCSRPTTSIAAGTARSSRRCSTSTSSRSPSTRSRSATASTSAARSRRSAAARPCSPWPRPSPSSRMPGATPTSCARWRMLRGLIRVGTEVAQLGYDRPGRHARAARHGRAEGLRDRAERHDRGLHAHQAAARRGLPPAHAAVRERRRQRRHGPPDRLRGARSPDLRPAEVEPRDPRRPALDGQDEPRAQHRRARRGDVAEARRAVLARDVQGRDRPAPAVLGRQGRPEPPEAGPARGRRLDARHRARWRRSAARRSSSTTRAP